MSYDRATVELLLPAVWDSEYAYGMRNPTAPDPDMPTGTVDKKNGGTLFAHLADIRSAWNRAPLTLEQRRALLMRFGFDMQQKEIAAREGTYKMAVSRTVESGVGALVGWLNGAPECATVTNEEENE